MLLTFYDRNVISLWVELFVYDVFSTLLGPIPYLILTIDANLSITCSAILFFLTNLLPCRHSCHCHRGCTEKSDIFFLWNTYIKYVCSIISRFVLFIFSLYSNLFGYLMICAEYQTSGKTGKTRSFCQCVFWGTSL